MISRAIGDRKGEGVDLGNLGNLYDDLGDTRRALACYEKALIIRREIGAMDLIASICYNMALMYARQGNIDRALPLAQESVDAFVRLGHLEYTQRAKGLVSQLQRKQSSLLYRLFSKKE